MIQQTLHKWLHHIRMPKHPCSLLASIHIHEKWHEGKAWPCDECRAEVQTYMLWLRDRKL